MGRVIQPFGARVDGYYDTHGQVGRHLIDRSTPLFDQADARRAAITNPEKLRSRALRIREVLLEAVGNLPAERSTAPAQIVGEVNQSDYRIEKLVFESLPNVPVAANLYLPRDRQQPAPAILLLCGHARHGKTGKRLQEVASLLARNGFVVLVADPIGQGERMQGIDRATGAQIVAWGTH